MRPPNVLHANLAQDLIDEKFRDAQPFDSTGTVNKALFGDIMHDMMAVNRAIEVYLLDEEGRVQYSVVLDHDAPETKAKRIDLVPSKGLLPKMEVAIPWEMIQRTLRSKPFFSGQIRYPRTRGICVYYLGRGRFSGHTERFVQQLFYAFGFGRVNTYTGVCHPLGHTCHLVSHQKSKKDHLRGQTFSAG